MGCAGFVCPAPMTLRLQPGRLVCAAAGCSAKHCCLMPTTTPCPTTVQPTPAPCSTKMQRLCSAQQDAVVQQAVIGAQTDSNASQTLVLPVLGMFAMLAMVVGGAASAYKLRSRRTRAMRTIEPRVEDEPLMEESVIE